MFTKFKENFQSFSKFEKIVFLIYVITLSLIFIFFVYWYEADFHSYLSRSYWQGNSGFENIFTLKNSNPNESMKFIEARIMLIVSEAVLLILLLVSTKMLFSFLKNKERSSTREGFIVGSLITIFIGAFVIFFNIAPFGGDFWWPLYLFLWITFIVPLIGILSLLGLIFKSHKKGFRKFLIIFIFLILITPYVLVIGGLLDQLEQILYRKGII